MLVLKYYNLRILEPLYYGVPNYVGYIEPWNVDLTGIGHYTSTTGGN